MQDLFPFSISILEQFFLHHPLRNKNPIKDVYEPPS